MEGVMFFSMICSHFAPITTGLSPAIDDQLRDLAQKTSPTLAKYVVVLIDEMYVKEGLVFDKTTGAITGYVDLDEFNNHFRNFENAIVQGNSKKTHRPFAKTLLMFMVRGVVTNFVFPYALYPAASLKGCDLFPLLWKVIERLTRNKFVSWQWHVMELLATGVFSSCTQKAESNLCTKQKMCLVRARSSSTSFLILHI